jgi:hexosaminidase
VGGDSAQINCTISAFEGGLYAVQTLRQLFYKHSQVSDAVLYTPFAPIAIIDKPYFTHLGLNLDIARNRIGPKDIM